MKKKTHKPNALRSWVEGGVISLYGLTQFSFLWDLPSLPSRLWLRYSYLKMFPLEGSVPMWKRGLSLEGEIVRYRSVSLSLTLDMNEKVEQHIRKKTHKSNALRFWVEGDVIPLYELTWLSFLWDLKMNHFLKVYYLSLLKIILNNNIFNSWSY